MEIDLAPQVRLWVQVAGQGQPVVFLHGHSLDLTVFDAVVPPLLAAGFCSVRYDQRGHGRSSSPPQGYRWQDHAHDLFGVVEKLQLGPVHLVGLSKGGGIALEAALRWPQLVRSLVLVGPLLPDYPLSPEFLSFFRAFARAIREKGVEEAVRSLWLPHPLLSSAWQKPQCGPQLEAMVCRFPAGEYLASFRDDPQRPWQVPEKLGSIAAPTLVVRGEGEMEEFCAMAQLVASRVPGARLAVVPNSGHLVPLEQPQAFARLLLEFLQSLPHP